jgi:CO/xanthine dehydrogenase FAD-binding subunit
MLPPFRYLAPGCVAEACRALLLHGSRAVIHAGGVDLVIRMKERTAVPEVVIDLSVLPELRGLSLGLDSLRIGSLTPVSRQAHDAFPLLSEVAGRIGAKIQNHP